MTSNLRDNKKAQGSVLLFLFILVLFLLTTAFLVILLISPDSTEKEETTNSTSDYDALEQDAVLIYLNQDIIDTDEDGIEDFEDNCPFHFNPFQEDRDEDGKGDACDLSKTSRSSHDEDDDIVCSKNSDCGTGGLTGNRFCQSEDVYQNYKNYTCNNPGKTTSSCSLSTTPQLIQDCSFGCSNGVCIVPSCSTNEDCDDNNNYTEDICKNPNTAQSYCEHNPISCLTNIDCGINSLIGSLFCSSDNLSVLQLFKSWTCVSPGTANSYCTSATQNQTIETCSDICVNGACQDIECNNNADCGTDGLIGQPTCSGLNIVQDFKIFTCNNPGTPQSSCSFSLCQEIQQICSDACIAGICVDIECYNNADCNDQNSQTQDTCHNPGTPQSYCTNEQILECIPGQTQQCGSSDVGACEFGTQTCSSSGTWGSCIGEILPSAEICDGIDNDCDGLTDENNVCPPVCTNECSPSGTKQCSGEGYKTCGNFDADSCLEWSGVIPCAYGCTNGNCNPQPPVCTSECPILGARQCMSGGYRICGNFDADSCLEWSLITQCGLGSTCSGGFCI